MRSINSPRHLEENAGAEAAEMRGLAPTLLVATDALEATDIAGDGLGS